MPGTAKKAQPTRPPTKAHRKGALEWYKSEGEAEETDLERTTETLTMERIVRIREAQ